MSLQKFLLLFRRDDHKQEYANKWFYCEATIKYVSFSNLPPLEWQ